MAEKTGIVASVDRFGEGKNFALCMKWGILTYGLQQMTARFQSYLIVVCVILRCEMRQMGSYDDDIWMEIRRCYVNRLIHSNLQEG